MNKALLRKLLREWITEEYVVSDLCEFEDEFDARGQAIPHRDRYQRSNESRLAGLQRVAPDRTDLHDMHRGILTALSNVSSDESLYYWSARSSAHDYSGVARAAGIISFYPVSRSADERQA